MEEDEDDFYGAAGVKQEQEEQANTDDGDDQDAQMDESDGEDGSDSDDVGHVISRRTRERGEWEMLMKTVQDVQFTLEKPEGTQSDAP